MEIKEIKIPVPWGFIAAKTWGDEKNEIIITMHGFQDNAGSFDTLIPLLPASYYYVCLDMPSHGYSSHIPNETFVTFLDFVVSLKLVLDYLERKRYILMGHSFGGQTALFFTQMFPEYVLILIMLDTLYYLPVDPKRALQEYVEIDRRYQKSLKNSQNSVPTYTKEEAVQRMVDNRFATISKKSAEIIMHRSLKPANDGKYSITSAQHLKYFLRPLLTFQYYYELMKYYPITCPHLVIMGSDSIIRKYVTKPYLKLLGKNKKFFYSVVKGDHDVHLEKPEIVAPIIIKFLEKHYKYKNKL